MEILARRNRAFLVAAEVFRERRKSIGGEGKVFKHSRRSFINRLAILTREFLNFKAIVSVASIPLSIFPPELCFLGHGESGRRKGGEDKFLSFQCL